MCFTLKSIQFFFCFRPSFMARLSLKLLMWSEGTRWPAEKSFIFLFLSKYVALERNSCACIFGAFLPPPAVELAKVDPPDDADMTVLSRVVSEATEGAFLLGA